MHNPYTPPESLVSPLPVNITGAEQIRRDHLSHEASVKSVGTLYLLSAGLTLLLMLGYGAAVLGALSRSSMGVSEIATIVGLGLLLLAIVFLQWKLATGLRQLRPWVRIPTIVLSIIGLLGFPIGTIISAYVLYLMCSAKSKMVFSPEYKQVIAETPHIRYRSNILMTVLVVVLLVILISGVAFSLARR